MWDKDGFTDLQLFLGITPMSEIHVSGASTRNANSGKMLKPHHLLFQQTSKEGICCNLQDKAISNTKTSLKVTLT